LEAKDDFRDLGQVLVLKNKVEGTVAVFAPGDIASLGFK